jgi:hypothetical protein
MQTIEALGTSLERSLADIQVSPGLSPADGAPDGQELAALAFFDIRWTYQLRFLRVLWNNSAESWDSIRSAVTENEAASPGWRQDSLRVSRMTKQSTSSDALDRKPQDYMDCCVCLSSIWSTVRSASIADFGRRWNRQDELHKIYASLILARLYKLSGDAMRFRHMLGEIGRLDAGCREAIYEDILFKLEEKDEKGAMKKLVKLVRDNPDLFVTVLIDPELAPHREHHLTRAPDGAHG